MSNNKFGPYSKVKILKHSQPNDFHEFEGHTGVVKEYQPSTHLESTYRVVVDGHTNTESVPFYPEELAHCLEN